MASNDKIEQPSTSHPIITSALQGSSWLTCYHRVCAHDISHDCRFWNYHSSFPQKLHSLQVANTWMEMFLGSPWSCAGGIQPLTSPFIQQKATLSDSFQPSNKIRHTRAAVLNRPALDTCCSRHRTGNIKGGLLLMV